MWTGPSFWWLVGFPLTIRSWVQFTHKYIFFKAQNINFLVVVSWDVPMSCWIDVVNSSKFWVVLCSHYSPCHCWAVWVLLRRRQCILHLMAVHFSRQALFTWLMGVHSSKQASFRCSGNAFLILSWFAAGLMAVHSSNQANSRWRRMW